MTQLKDPYPETLDDIPFTSPGAPTFGTSGVRFPVADALNRIALALEQLTVLIADRTQPAQNAPGAALAALPPVQAQQPVVVAPPVPAGAPPKPAGVCPVHGTGWDKLVPAGTSRSTGKPYTAFWACPTKGCDQRPPR